MESFSAEIFNPLDQLTQLQVKLLHTLGPRYLSDALDWVGVHQDRILFTITNALKEPITQELLQEADTVLAFLIEISDYKEAWIREVGQVKKLEFYFDAVF